MMIRTDKWGRGLSMAGAAALCIMLCLSSCGSAAKEEHSPDTGYESAAAVGEQSQVKEDPASSDPIERLSGRYYIDGDAAAASVVIDSDGSFTACYASGTVEQKGYVRYETDHSGENSYHVYVFYTDEGKPYMGFVDSGESRISEFETGNGSYRYVRVE
jgi:hypothetical protein